MQKIEFGSTGLVIEKNGFGCLPIQRISETEAVKLLLRLGTKNVIEDAQAEREKETDHIRRKVEEQKQKLLGKKNEIKKKK